MATTAAAIKATMGLDTAPLKRGLADAERATLSFSRRFKGATTGLVGAFGGGAFASSIRNAVNGMRELSEASKLSEEAIRSLGRVNAGVTEEQAQAVADMAENYDAAARAAQGLFSKIIIGIKNVKNGSGGFLDPFRGRSIADNIFGGLTGNGPDKQTIKPSSEDQQKILQQRKKAEDDIKKLREKIAIIDEDIADKQQRAAEERMGIAGKIAQTERRINEAKAGQVGQADELVSAELRRKQALEEIVLEEQKIEQIKQRADAILAGPDARREDKRAGRDRERAEGRAARELDLEARGGLSKQDFDMKQRRKPAPVGEVQGPPAPPKDNAASEATLKSAVEKLSEIAAAIGVRV